MDDNNLPNLNIAYVGVPVTSSKGITAATVNETKHVNFNLLPVYSRNGPPGASIFSFQQPCVHWFGEDYPASELYERPVDLDQLASPLGIRLSENSRIRKSSSIQLRDR